MPVLSQLASERVKLVKFGSTSTGVSNTTGNVASDGLTANDSGKFAGKLR